MTGPLEAFIIKLFDVGVRTRTCEGSGVRGKGGGGGSGVRVEATRQ